MAVFSKKVKKYYENLYKNGGYKGPTWYQCLKSIEINREEVATKFINNGDKFLDIGCGFGNLVLDSSTKFNNVYGVDIAQNRIKVAIEKAKKRGIKNACFKISDLNTEALPFPDNFFETITCISVLEHIFDPYSLISEAKRVLKREGIFIVETINIAYLPERIKLLLGQVPGWAKADGWQGGRLHQFTFSSLEKLLNEYKFKIVKRTCSGIFTPVRLIWPSLLSGDIIFVSKKE